jgi:hypothetical protein
MGTLRTIGGCEVLISPQYVETRFPDGTRVPAIAEDTAAYRQTAIELGYGADTARMNREHDPLHTWLASKQGLPRSPVLWAVAHGVLTSGDFGSEERQTLAFQRLLNGGARSAPSTCLRHLAELGSGLDALLDEATALLGEIDSEIAVLEAEPPPAAPHPPVIDRNATM